MVVVVVVLVAVGLLVVGVVVVGCGVVSPGVVVVVVVWMVLAVGVLVVACVVDRAKRKPGKSTRARARLTKSGSRQEFVSRDLAHKKWLGVNVNPAVSTEYCGVGVGLAV